MNGPLLRNGARSFRATNRRGRERPAHYLALALTIRLLQADQYNAPASQLLAGAAFLTARTSGQASG